MSAGPSAANTKRASFLELFFDLVFVFAITQLAGMLHDDHSPGGWGRAALMAWLLWWAWSQYAWAGNAIDLDRRTVRAAVLGVTGVMLLAATAIPDAFSGDGLWFAVPYAIVRAAGLGLYWAGLRDDPAHRAALRSYLPLACVSPVLVLVGGAAPSGVRPWIWLAAVAVDVGSALAAGRGEFRVAPAHFAERHALIVIIALGESIIAAGATVSDLVPDLALAVTATTAFLIVALLWWEYFDWVQAATEHRLEAEADHRVRGRLARDLYTFGHLPLVAGTVVFAVGVEEAVLHPSEPLDAFGVVAVTVGLVLVLIGFVGVRWRASGQIPVERGLAAVAVLALGAVVGPNASAVALLTALAVLLIASTAAESVRRRTADVA